MKNKISHAPSHPSLICLISLFPSSTDDWHFSYLLTSFFLFQFNRSSSLQSSGLLSVAAAKLYSFIHGPMFIVRLLCVAAHAPCVQWQQHARTHASDSFSFSPDVHLLLLSGRLLYSPVIPFSCIYASFIHSLFICGCDQLRPLQLEMKWKSSETVHNLINVKRPILTNDQPKVASK